MTNPPDFRRSRRRRATRLAVVPASLALAVGAVAAPAQATATRVDDPVGDAPARWDAHSATFIANARRVAVRIDVPGLRRSGVARLYLAIPDSDGISVATIRKRADGTVRRTYASVGLDGARIPCRVAGAWRPARDRVVIKVPRRCVERFTTQTPLTMEALVGTQRRGDRVAGGAIALP